MTYTAGAATQLAFVQQPTNLGANQAIVPYPTVEILDASKLTSSTANVALAIGTNPSSGTRTGDSPTAAVAGLATFSGLSIDNTGNGYTLTTSARLAPATGPGRRPRRAGSRSRTRLRTAPTFTYVSGAPTVCCRHHDGSFTVTATPNGQPHYYCPTICRLDGRRRLDGGAIRTR